jgi:hypothetical protein
VWCFTGCRLVTDSKAVASSASMFTSFLSGDCLSTYSYSSHCRIRTLSQTEQSRAEHSSSLLPATSQHGHSWHRSLLGPMAIYLLNVKTFVFFFFRSSSYDKKGVGRFYNWCSLTTPFPPEVTLGWAAWHPQPASRIHIQDLPRRAEPPDTLSLLAGYIYRIFLEGLSRLRLSSC